MLDVLRGLAALWVALYHLSEGRHIPTLLGQMPAWAKAAFFDAGHLGVPVFFVLSGVVMVLTTREIRMTGPVAGRFVARRLLRLIPPYYLAILVGMASILVKHLSDPSGPPLPSLTDTLAHLLFIQDFLGRPQILVIFWTLCIEVQFYLAFALLLWMTDRFAGSRLATSRLPMIVVVAVSSLAWPAGIVHSTGWPGGFIGLWFSFMAGVLCGQVMEGTRHARLALWLYCAGLLAIGIHRSDAFACTAAVTGLGLCLLWDAPRASAWLSSAPARGLGTISYSLYLFHLPVTGTFMRVYRRMLATGLLADTLALLMVMAACIGFAALAYWLVERPAQAWSRRIQLA